MMVIWGKLYAIEAKECTLDIGKAANTIKLLDHPFSKLQISTLRQISRAGGGAFGAIKIAHTPHALVFPAGNIPDTGNLNVDEYKHILQNHWRWLTTKGENGWPITTW